MLAASYLCSMNNNVRLSSLQIVKYAYLPTLATQEPKMQNGHNMIINRNLQRNRCTSSVLSVSLFLRTPTGKFNPRVKDFFYVTW